MLIESLKNNWRTLIPSIVTFSIGVLGTILVAFDANAYVASITFFFVFIIALFLGAVLLIISLFAFATQENKRIGVSILLAALMLPGGLIVSSVTAKNLQLGAYREEPMVSLIPETSNKVIFKKGTSEKQISDFSDTTISDPHPGGGHWPIPGIQGVFRPGAENGSEQIIINYRVGITTGEREYIHQRINASPIVEKFLENVPIKSDPTPLPISDGNIEPKGPPK